MNDEGMRKPHEKTSYGFGLSSFVINSDFADLDNLRRHERTLNQPRARLVLTNRTAAPVVLEIQYTVPQNIFETIEANSAIKNKFDGVAVQIITEGAAYNTSALLNLDPQRRSDDRKWLSYNLVLPSATKEIHFSIIGIPPRYNVFWATCVISPPQLRVTPAKSPAAPIAKPASATENH